VLRRTFAGVFIWLCVLRVPVSVSRDSAPQSWEAVLSYAAANHLQWGRDIVFTFGPLGFLTSDYYWGNFFWPIIFWAAGFAFALTPLLLAFLTRTAPALRLVFYIALPLLTVPTCADLGFDPIYLIAITLFGIACLPAERPAGARLFGAGLILTLLTFIKFTFALYGGFVLLIILLSNWRAGTWKNSLVLGVVCLACFVSICWWRGQTLSSVQLYFARSFQVASGYSSGMALPPTSHDLVTAVVILSLLAALVAVHCLGSEERASTTNRAAIVMAGIFLAWKEGFVRPDIHPVVFLIYCFLLAALLPGLMPHTLAANPAATGALEPGPLAEPRRAFAGGVSRFKQSFGLCPGLLLAAAVMLVCLTPFVRFRRDFARAVQTGFLPRASDTLMAVFSPGMYRQRLEGQLEAMRGRTSLPRIRAAVADASVDVLGYEQHLAILNGLNYTPHPVFQSYSAYTAGLQRLNSAFFSSDKAPQYVLWRSGTIDERYPTLDDGEVLLKILSEYSPCMQEEGFTLWKRNRSSPAGYSLTAQTETLAQMDQWVSITREPTWLRVEVRETWFGKIQSLLRGCSPVQIEVRLESGRTLRYRLLPGNASYGFVLSPLLQTDADLLGPVLNPQAPARVTAARILVGNSLSFAGPVRFVQQTIGGISALQFRHVPSRSTGFTLHNEL
jgi:hypothetical protein